MTKATFPATIETLTCEWLTRALRADEILDCGKISNFSVEPITGGYTSQVFRLQLDYSGEAYHPSQWASVNGGLDAGRNSAKQVAQYIKNS